MATDGTNKTGVQMIAEERVRQRVEKGWNDKHDDGHQRGELAQAAEAYVSTAQLQIQQGATLPPCFRHRRWPWHPSEFKASDDPIRNLVKAGALIAAEIDRLTRAKANESKRAEEKFETCEAVGHCPRPTAQAAPFHHFYCDHEREAERMEAIHGEGGRGHEDPEAIYGAVKCKTCGRQALVNCEADDFPQI